MLAQRERPRAELSMPPPLSPTAGFLLPIKQTQKWLCPRFFPNHLRCKDSSGLPPCVPVPSSLGSLAFGVQGQAQTGQFLNGARSTVLSPWLLPLSPALPGCLWPLACGWKEACLPLCITSKEKGAAHCFLGEKGRRAWMNSPGAGGMSLPRVAEPSGVPKPAASCQ